MSPTIEIDAEVFEALQSRAEPLVDTANSVLRRVLGIDQGEQGAVEPGDGEEAGPTLRRTGTTSHGRRTLRKRAKPESMLPEEEYELPILEALVNRGGAAPTSEVIDELGERLKHRLTPTDKQKLRSGQIRWRNRAQFVRLKLVRRGDMEKDSPRGVWVISEQGIDRVRRAGRA